MTGNEYHGLDHVDMRLIRELEVDGRQSVADMAKNLSLSRPTLHRRLERILESGNVRVVPIIGPAVLRFRTVAMVALRVRSSEVKRIAAKLASYQSVPAAIICAGRYDIIAWIIARDRADLTDFSLQKLENLSGVVGIKTIVALQIKKMSIAYLASQDDRYSKESWAYPGQGSYPEFDPLDTALIRELDINGRQSVTNLAKKMGKSRNFIRKKLDGLLKSGIIKVAGLVTDSSALGFHAVAMTGINTRPGQVEAVADRLMKHKNVHLVIIASGHYQLVIWTMFRDNAELSNFLLNHLGDDRDVIRTETMVNLQVSRLSFSFMAADAHGSEGKLSVLSK